MNDAQLQAKLTELLALPQETEWAEFKHNNSDPQLIGEYLSAISNSAALESQPFGYIVWGIEDGTHNVIGTSFKPRQQKGQGNEDLEPWLNKLLAPRINFRIFEFKAEGNSMVLFEVQAANTAPVAFSGRRYVRVGSHKKPLGEHPERERSFGELSPAQWWTGQQAFVKEQRWMTLPRKPLRRLEANTQNGSKVIQRSRIWPKKSGSGTMRPS